MPASAAGIRQALAEALREAALGYARRGWPVFPCTVGGKTPLTAHGFQDATTDPEIIAQWWRACPQANAAVATGAIIAVDVDPRHGGGGALAALEAQHGPLPETPRALTPGGGCHYYFKAPAGITIPCSAGKLAPGLDIRAAGGYVVAPPSERADGQYRWDAGAHPDDVPLAEVPAWLLRLILGPAEDAHRPAEPLPELIVEGARNATLTSLAGSLRRRRASEAAIVAALLAENEARCEPPLPEAEVRKIAASVARYEFGFGSHPKDEVAAETNSARPLVFRTPGEVVKEAGRETPWLARPFLALGSVSELTGKAKAGKSTFAFFACKSVLAGERFLREPTLQTSVVYLTEQPAASLAATLARAGLAAAPDLHLLLWRDCIGRPWAEIAAAALAKGQEVGARLLVVDTLPQFAQLRGDAENQSGAALEALEPLQRATGEGLAVLVVRHERKSGGEQGDAGRGSSAFAGAVDTLISLRRQAGDASGTTRVLSLLSRFDGPESVAVELRDGEYVGLGTAAAAAVRQARQAVLDVIPASPGEGLSFNETVARTGCRRSSVQEALGMLMDEGALTRTGSGKKGDPYKYRQGGEEPPEFASAATNAVPRQKERAANSIPPRPLTRVGTESGFLEEV